ncbi:MAG TPA: hypothetical protein VGB46_02700 [Flavisolibacter sp.]
MGRVPEGALRHRSIEGTHREALSPENLPFVEKSSGTCSRGLGKRHFPPEEKKGRKGRKKM